MRDHFEFSELCFYFFSVALIMPSLSFFEHKSPWQMGLLIFLFAPIPLYFARIHISFPEWLDKAMEMYAVRMPFVGLLSLVGVLGYSVFRWLA